MPAELLDKIMGMVIPDEIEVKYSQQFQLSWTPDWVPNLRLVSKNFLRANIRRLITKRVHVKPEKPWSKLYDRDGISISRLKVSDGFLWRSSLSSLRGMWKDLESLEGRGG